MDKRSQANLHAYIDELCLTTVRRRYAEIAQKAEKNAWGYETYLLEVLREESEARKNRRTDRLLRQSDGLLSLSRGRKYYFSKQLY
jgi:DNA replication protein DnaC